MQIIDARHSKRFNDRLHEVALHLKNLCHQSLLRRQNAIRTVICSLFPIQFSQRGNCQNASLPWTHATTFSLMYAKLGFFMYF